MIFEHTGPDSFDTLAPQTYSDISSSRGDKYPIEKRREYERKIKKMLGIEDGERSFTSFSLRGKSKMPHKGGAIHSKRFSPEEIEKIYFEAVVDEGDAIGGVGKDGLRAAIDYYKRATKKIIDMHGLKIHPRVEAYVPFEVKPDKITTNKYAKLYVEELTKRALYWSKDIQREVLTPHHKYGLGYLTGEIKELIEEIKGRNLPAIKDEFSDVAYAAQMIPYQRLPINLPVFGANSSVKKFYDRRDVWRDIFSKYNTEFKNDYLSVGSNYTRPAKVKGALELAGIEISEEEAENIAREMEEKYGPS
jgi:hypothetical protein